MTCKFCCRGGGADTRRWGGRTSAAKRLRRRPAPARTQGLLPLSRRARARRLHPLSPLPSSSTRGSTIVSNACRHHREYHTYERHKHRSRAHALSYAVFWCAAGAVGRGAVSRATPATDVQEEQTPREGDAKLQDMQLFSCTAARAAATALVRARETLVGWRGALNQLQHPPPMGEMERQSVETAVHGASSSEPKPSPSSSAPAVVTDPAADPRHTSLLACVGGLLADADAGAREAGAMLGRAPRNTEYTGGGRGSACKGGARGTLPGCGWGGTRREVPAPDCEWLERSIIAAYERV
ncbi:hypothetical protein B0H19DRAFT_1196130 [Mycena capillaripes]|nr:hypothetical protein B0H19DRAFT_1196130 [Mycena capillaripes]